MRYYLTMNPPYLWYQALIKPSWAPPPWIFSPVWSVLYFIIAISYGAVFLRAVRGELSWIIFLPFALNLIFNFAFSLLQFILQSNLLGSIDILFVLGTIVWMMVAIWPHMSWVVYANIPYLLWVSFATLLQLTITYLNFGK